MTARPGAIERAAAYHASVRLSLVTLLALAACSGSPEPGAPGAPQVDPAPQLDPAPPPAPPPEPGPPPRPRGLRATLDGATLVVSRGALEARAPLSAEDDVVLLDLTSDGAERGVWIGRGPGSTLFRLAPEGLDRIHGAGPAWTSHGIAGSSVRSESLADVDGDGRYEIVVRTSRMDDTGMRQSPPRILAQGEDGRFVPRDDLGLPRRARARDERELEDAVGGEVAATASFGTDWITEPRSDEVGTLGGGRAYPPQLSSSTIAVLAAARESGSLSVHVVRVSPLPVAVLASAPVGEHAPAGDEACLARLGRGSPLLRTATLTSGERVISIVRATGASRIASSVAWDGASLSPALADTGLDRCDGPSRDLALDRDRAPADALRPAPLPADRSRLW